MQIFYRYVENLIKIVASEIVWINSGIIGQTKG